MSDTSGCGRQMRHHHHAAHARQLAPRSRARARASRASCRCRDSRRRRTAAWARSGRSGRARRRCRNRASRRTRPRRSKSPPARAPRSPACSGMKAATRSPAAQALGAHRLRHARHLGVQFGIAEAAAKTGLVPEHERVGRVAPAQHVLGEIEPRLGKPLRAGHALAVDQHARAFFRGDHAAEVPHRIPELLGMVHAPVVEFRIGVETQLPAPDRAARERGEIRLLDQRLAGRPHRLFGHRLHRHVEVCTDI